MGKKSFGIHHALKHGVYSGTSLLPGEDQDEFERLHKKLIAEFNPLGPLEEDIVATMARLVWRKRNLGSYRLAALASSRIESIRSQLVSQVDGLRLISPSDPEEVKAAEKTADESALKELGPFYELGKLGDVATIEYLDKELSLVDRLDGMIDRCIKRLLLVRGLKSISPSVSKGASGTKRIAAT
jgi:hypothetical protein